MGRPGFVLDVDERTPPLVVNHGDGFRRERFPLGTKVVYPAEPAPRLADVREAIGAALAEPLESAPLAERLRPGMRLTIAFDDNTRPIPPMRRPDIRGQVIEAVLSQAAAAGVDDVALICANGLGRRLTEAELLHLLGERVFRSFYGDALLTNHDAEDADNLTELADGVAVNARVAASDLVVYVHVVVSARQSGAHQVARGLGSTATIERLEAGDAAAVESSVPIFQIDAVLDNDVFGHSAELLGKREWEWGVKERGGWVALRRGLALTPPRARRRVLTAGEGNYHPIAVYAGAPSAIEPASRAALLGQQVVEVGGQSDVGIIGVPAVSPYSVGSLLNPILAAWMGMVGILGAHTGRPVVRQGGALILYHPLPSEFSGLHHPSYVDFFAEALAGTAGPDRATLDALAARYAADPWYAHLYRNSFAFHGVHPIHRWREVAAAAAQLGDVVWVGGDRATVARLGFRAASTLADALEIVASGVGRTPSIAYLHSPPQLVADVR